MPHARTHDGTRIHYRVVGPGRGGRTVVMLQGLGLSGRFWFQMPERVAAATGDRVLVVDNRGTGESDRPLRPWRMGTMADDVAAVMDDAGVASAIVAGISMGGMIAQHVALRHPSRVEGLVLMATTPGLPHGRLASPRALATLARLPFLRGAAARRASASILLPPAHVERAAELLGHWAPAFAQDPIRPRTFFVQLGAILGHSTGARLPAVRAPTIVVAAAHDALVPLEATRAIAELVPGAELEVLPDVGHSIPTLDPDVVPRAVLRLRARTGASEGARSQERT